MGVSSQRHAPAALLPPGKGPPVPIVQEACIMYQQLWGYNDEEKLYLGVREQKSLNTTDQSRDTRMHSGKLASQGCTEGGQPEFGGVCISINRPEYFTLS
jgi:hypothetical protein